MASVLYATGERPNVLERSTVALSAGTADPLFVLANLWDGRPSKPFRFSTLTDVERITVDLNVVQNGDMEAGVTDSWESGVNGGTGTIVNGTAAGEFNGGVIGAEMTAGTAGVFLRQDLTVPAGELRHLTTFLRGDGVNPITVRLQNLVTGRFLNSSGAWVTTASNVLTETFNAYVPNSRTYTVESFLACGRDLVTLRLTIIMAVGKGYADDVYDYPRNQDLLSLHGVLVDDRCTVTWETTDDPGLGYANGLSVGNPFLQDQKPSFYIKRSSGLAKRFQRISFDNGGTAQVNVREIGEALLVQSATATRNHDWGYEQAYMEEDIASESGDGDLQVYVRCRWPRRAFAAERQFVTEAGMQEARDDQWHRARGRKLNFLLVPDDTKQMVMLGRLGVDWRAMRQFSNHYASNAFAFTELPFVSTAL